MPKPPQTQRKGIALIGMGRWGSRWFSTLHGHPESDLLWVCDLSASESTVEGVSHTAQLQRALGDPKVDGVIVCTPSTSHAEVAEAALLAGKHVLVEKPLATSAAAAARLVALARQVGRNLLVDHLLAYHPAFVRLQQLVDQGVIGKVVGCLGRRFSGPRARSDCALWALAPHDLSLLYRLRPDMLGSMRLDCSERPGVGVLLGPDGSFGRLDFDTDSEQKLRRFAVVGERGVLLFDGGRSPALWHFRGEWSPSQLARYWDDGEELPGGQPVGHPDRQVLELVLSHFLEVIEGITAPETPGEEGAAVVAALAAQRPHGSRVAARAARVQNAPSRA